MSASAPTLGGLGEDIVLRILSSSDIFTTLSVSRINRHLYHITSAKQLWLLHVQDLIDRSVIELPPSVVLVSLSTADLVDLVRRLVVGPATWAAEQLPQVSTEITIRTMHDQPAGSRGRFRVKLLDGGRHILFSRETLLELWDVATQQLVWSREPIFPQILNFAATPGARSVVVTALRADDTGLAISLEIHEIDTLTGESAVHLTLPIVAQDCSSDPTMCDGLVLIPMLLTALAEGALLVDWRGRRCMLLETGLLPEVPAVGLIPGHIIMATTAREKPAINIYALEVLEPLWQPVDDLNFRAPTKITADPLYVLPLPMKSQPTRVLGLFVHASPLRWDTFEVTAHVEYSPSWSMADRAARRGVARLSYNAALDSDLRGGRLEWAADVSSGRTSDDVQEMRQLSYAGYAVDGRTHRLSRSAEPPRVLEGTEQCKWTHLSAYSGVVARVMPSAVVVSYHR